MLDDLLGGSVVASCSDRCSRPAALRRSHVVARKTQDLERFVYPPQPSDRGDRDRLPPCEISLAPGPDELGCRRRRLDPQDGPARRAPGNSAAAAAALARSSFSACLHRILKASRNGSMVRPVALDIALSIFVGVDRIHVCNNANGDGDGEPVNEVMYRRVVAFSKSLRFRQERGEFPDTFSFGFGSLTTTISAFFVANTPHCARTTAMIASVYLTGLGAWTHVLLFDEPGEKAPAVRDLWVSGNGDGHQFIQPIVGRVLNFKRR